MRITRSRRLRDAVLVVGLALCGGVVISQADVRPAVAGETDTIYTLVNEARFADGSKGFLRNADLDSVAAGWAAQLARNGTLSHNPEYSSQIPDGWVGAAENVAQGYQGGASLHEGWMKSQGHRENILGDYTDIGIAYLEEGGTTWGVEVFAKYSANLSSLPVPAPVTPPPPVEPTPEPPAAPKPEPTPAPTPAPTATPNPAATPQATSTPIAAASDGSDNGSGAAAVAPWTLGSTAVLGAGLLAFALFRRSRRGGASVDAAVSRNGRRVRGAHSARH